MDFFDRTFKVPQWVHKGCLAFAFYPTQMGLIEQNLARGSLSLVTRLSLGLVNAFSLSKHATDWTGVLMLTFCCCLVCYCALMSMGCVALLCDERQKRVTYRWGFVIQTYVNLWVALKAVTKCGIICCLA